MHALERGERALRFGCQIHRRRRRQPRPRALLNPRLLHGSRSPSRGPSPTSPPLSGTPSLTRKASTILSSPMPFSRLSRLRDPRRPLEAGCRITWWRARFLRLLPPPLLPPPLLAGLSALYPFISRAIPEGSTFLIRAGQTRATGWESLTTQRRSGPSP